jgi:hypothetical protein
MCTTYTSSKRLPTAGFSLLILIGALKHNNVTSISEAVPIRQALTSGNLQTYL